MVISLEFPHDGFSPFDAVAYGDTNLRTKRKKRIHPRAKSDQAEPFTTLHVLTLRDPTDDPAGNQPGNLHAEHFRPGLGL